MKYPVLSILSLGLIAVCRFANAHEFPCNLDQLKPVTLTLYGELHTDPACEKFRCQKRLQALKGEEFLGLEGIGFGESLSEALSNLSNPSEEVLLPPSSSRIYGIEDKLADGFHALLLSVRDFRGHAKSESYFLHLKELWLKMRSNQYLRESWQLLRKKPFANPIQEQIASVLDEAIKSHWESSKAKQVIQVLGFQQEMPAQTFQLTSDWVMSYIQMAKTKKTTEKVSVPENIDSALDCANIFKLYKSAQIALAWRNKGIAKNLAALYCSALSEGKNLGVIVGQDHLKDLMTLLNSMSDNKIQIQTRDVSDLDGVDLAMVKEAELKTAKQKYLYDLVEGKGQPMVTVSAPDSKTALNLTNSSSGKICQVCKMKPGSKRCGQCQRVFYCSVDCQKKDWARHKPECKSPIPTQKETAASGTGAAPSAPMPSTQGAATIK